MNEEKIPLYNPLQTPFEREWFDDTNKKHILVMPSCEITFFPSGQHRFMLKHLVDKVLVKRNINPLLPLEREAVKKEVTDMTL